MRSTFYGLEVARSGLYTSQNQLNVTGHNIANVETVGYTRQRLDTAALEPIAYNVQFAVDNSATAGRGVEALNVNQIRDPFLDMTYREEASDLGYWETLREEYSMIEMLYNSTLDKADGVSLDTSVNGALEQFHAALSAFESDPATKELRTALVLSGTALTESFNYAYEKLVEQHNDVNDAIKVQVDTINDLTANIANLNRQIFAYEMTGDKANDLRDEQNLMIDQLSAIVKIDYHENSQGYLVVTLNGRELVDGVDSFKLAVESEPGFGAPNQLDVLANEPEASMAYQYNIVWADAFGQPSKYPGDKVYVESGSLRAYLEMRDSLDHGIPSAVEDLNNLARKIAMEINEVHINGYTMPFIEESMIGHTIDDIKRYDANGNLIPAATDPFPTDTLEVFDADGNLISSTDYYESTTGIAFFYIEVGGYENLTAGNFRISDEVQLNPYLVAAAAEKVHPEGGEDGAFSSNQNTGDKLNIIKIMELFDRENEMGMPDNYSDGLKALITDVSSVLANFNSLHSAQEVRVEALVSQRVSISGVSIDEEMTNIITFQHAYNANARIITAIDEELDTLINKMGLVGR